MVVGKQERGELIADIDCSSWNFEFEEIVGTAVRSWITKELKRGFYESPPRACIYPVTDGFVVNVGLPLSQSLDDHVAFDFDLGAMIAEFPEMMDPEERETLAAKLEEWAAGLRCAE